MKWKELKAFLDVHFDDNDYIAVYQEPDNGIVFYKDKDEIDAVNTPITIGAYNGNDIERDYTVESITKHFRRIGS